MRGLRGQTLKGVRGLMGGLRPGMAVPVKMTPGQQEWLTPGTYQFTVPAFVSQISAVAVGAGGAGRATDPLIAGGGGGLHWVNNAQVKAGDVLTVTVGAGPAANDGGLFAPDSSVQRADGTYIVRGGGGQSGTGGGTTGGLGGSTYVSTLGGGGGNGGQGGGATTVKPAGGGGAGGYAGQGGEGGDAPAALGTAEATHSGGGAGGNANDAVGGGTSGQGAGLHGRTLNYEAGSRGTACGAGGRGQAAGGGGGVRIIWGASRTYPDNAQDV